jgi:hypothetical protein
MNIEKLKKILDEAPEGATHYDQICFLKLDNMGDAFWRNDQWWLYSFQESGSISSLADIKLIVELHELITELRATIGDFNKNKPETERLKMLERNEKTYEIYELMVSDTASHPVGSSLKFGDDELTVIRVVDKNKLRVKKEIKRD